MHHELAAEYAYPKWTNIDPNDVVALDEMEAVDPVEIDAELIGGGVYVRYVTRWERVRAEPSNG